MDSRDEPNNPMHECSSEIVIVFVCMRMHVWLCIGQRYFENHAQLVKDHPMSRT
jgi:hypothetical protein